MTAPLDDVATGDYLVPIYVDTGALMDVLASIEGGFTSMEKVTSKTETSAESARGFDFSLGGTLSFLKLDLKGNRGTKDGSKAGEERSGDRYHSPGSLLNRLRRHLRDNELLQVPRWDNVRPSQFVEFRGVFRPNPLTEALGSMKRIMELLKAWPQFRNAKKGEISVTEVMKMIDALLADLEGGGRKLFVIEPEGGPHVRVVAPVLLAHLRDQTQAELSHGDFRVTAKVVRRLDDPDGEGVHLLPGSGIGSAGMMHDAIVQAVQFGKELGMKIPEKIEVEVRAPVVVVLPIGISV